MKSCKRMPWTLPPCKVTSAVKREEASQMTSSESKGTTTSQTISRRLSKPDFSLRRTDASTSLRASTAAAPAAEWLSIRTARVMPTCANNMPRMALSPRKASVERLQLHARWTKFQKTTAGTSWYVMLIATRNNIAIPSVWKTSLGLRSARAMKRLVCSMCTLYATPGLLRSSAGHAEADQKKKKAPMVTHVWPFDNQRGDCTTMFTHVMNTLVAMMKLMIGAAITMFISTLARNRFLTASEIPSSLALPRHGLADRRCQRRITNERH
mmetsp:Transcript_120094/g.336230  ORF Transcript_120094/g.336230 Transcript_120094/m.336230 type:complete len:268 (+) Transcript_120094:3-806(+)